MSHLAPKNEALPSPEEFISRCEREHRILKELYSDLVVAYNQHYRRQTTGKILHVLEMYVKFHFSNEERFMKNSGYPDIKNHTDIHNKFIAVLGDIIKSFRGGADVYESLRKIYYDLSTGHIPETDEELLRFVRGLPKGDGRATAADSLAWDDGYRTGIGMIDQEHEALFALYREAMATGSGAPGDRKRVLKAVAALDGAMREHFRNEEELMDETGYADRVAHHKQHDHFLSQFGRLRKKIEEGAPDDDAMRGFFKNWVGCHLMISDKDFGAFLVERRGRPLPPLPPA